MRRASWLLSLALFGQSAAFDVASVKPCANLVGPDYNNTIKYLPAGYAGRHATLARLITDAYGIQARQVIGPSWIDQVEYDLLAKTSGPTDAQRYRACCRRYWRTVSNWCNIARRARYTA